MSQAKGAFSSWWSNLLVSPETGQKGDENDIVCGAEAVQQNDSDIPKSINENLSNGNIKTNDNCNVNKSPNNENHLPGEIHTV